MRQQLPLVVVEWEDTTNVGNWLNQDELAEFVTDGSWRCVNVGYLVHEDDDCVVLSARLADDSDRHVGLTERIPKRAIVTRRIVEKAGRR